MPVVLERQVAALKRAGKDTSSAFAIATASLQKRGLLKKKKKGLMAKPPAFKKKRKKK